MRLMAKTDRPEHRLSHHTKLLIERIVEQPYWATAIDTGTYMPGATPEQRFARENHRKWMGIVPAAPDWMIYQRPTFACFELKIATNVSANQEVTLQALRDRKIPVAVCRTI